MRKSIITAVIILVAVILLSAGQKDLPVWPLAPDKPRVEYIGEIKLNNLEKKSGFWSKVKRLIGGSSPVDMISHPFDIMIIERTMYMTCQNLAALIEVNLNDYTFKTYNSNSHPMKYPISLCSGGEGVIFITDSESASVYRFSDGRITPFITDNLSRPTGIAALKDMEVVFVVDTGDHTVKVFDYDGNIIKKISGQTNSETGFNFPTFAVSDCDNKVLINDALNYRIKSFDVDGNFKFSFGEEGDGPGTFSRPKGIAVDSEDNIYVVDNLFDNIQIFNREGKLLLVIGSAGQNAGQFWSPAGIDIANDTIYVADTFNNRIQILRYLRGEAH